MSLPGRVAQHVRLQRRRARARASGWGAPRPSVVADVAHQLLAACRPSVRKGRSAPSVREVVVERVHEAVRDIADIDRLEPRARARPTRRIGSMRDRRAKRLRKRIVAAEDHRGPEDRPAQVRRGDDRPRPRPWYADTATARPDRRPARSSAAIASRPPAWQAVTSSRASSTCTRSKRSAAPLVQDADEIDRRRSAPREQPRVARAARGRPPRPRRPWAAGSGAWRSRAGATERRRDVRPREARDRDGRRSRCRPVRRRLMERHRLLRIVGCRLTTDPRARRHDRRGAR